MTLVRWKPVNEIMGIHNEIDRMLEGMLRGVQGTSVGAFGWLPAVDLRENEKEFTLVAELPGLSKDDVRISLTENVLSLRGEKKHDHEARNENWHQVERTYGRFERQFLLTSPVDPSAIKARFADGLLTVTLPKAEEARPREIKIEF